MVSDVRLDDDVVQLLGKKVDLVGNLHIRDAEDGQTRILLDSGSDVVPDETNPPQTGDDFLQTIPTYIGFRGRIRLGASGTKGGLRINSAADQTRVYIDGGVKRSADEEPNDPEPEPDRPDEDRVIFDESLIDISNEPFNTLPIRPSSVPVVELDLPYRIYGDGENALFGVGGDGMGGRLWLTNDEDEPTIVLDGRSGQVIASDGIVLESSGGNSFRLTVDDDGNLETEPV